MSWQPSWAAGPAAGLGGKASPVQPVLRPLRAGHGRTDAGGLQPGRALGSEDPAEGRDASSTREGAHGGGLCHSPPLPELGGSSHRLADEGRGPPPQVEQGAGVGTYPRQVHDAEVPNLTTQHIGVRDILITIYGRKTLDSTPSLPPFTAYRGQIGTPLE